MLSDTLGIIGYGNMGSAIIRGLIGKNIFDAKNICVYDTDPNSCKNAAEDGCRVLDSIAEVGTQSDTVIIGVKPGIVRNVLGELVNISPDTLIISIAAGISTEKIETVVPDKPVVRVMPNTPCMVGEGASALTRGKNAGDNHVETAQKIMGALGYAVEVPEYLMDAVTGLSGSGPAYVALVIDALTDGGVRVGLPRSAALRLAAQTVLGAAKMVLERNIAPSALRDMVTSPGGTTIEGISVLEAHAFRSALIEAVGAATHKSKELGR
ncbi:MAG: pyrroline-5-carboxylate reductase [Candidatus Latescibacteria bacterium]|nr:pyrroline-5-carboxylate reductase [Candidatus Latescibacterota bacterium]